MNTKHLTKRLKHSAMSDEHLPNDTDRKWKATVLCPLSANYLLSTEICLLLVY